MIPVSPSRRRQRLSTLFIEIASRRYHHITGIALYLLTQTTSPLPQHRAIYALSRLGEASKHIYSSSNHNAPDICSNLCDGDNRKKSMSRTNALNRASVSPDRYQRRLHSHRHVVLNVITNRFDLFAIWLNHRWGEGIWTFSDTSPERKMRPPSSSSVDGYRQNFDQTSGLSRLKHHSHEWCR